MQSKYFDTECSYLNIFYRTKYRPCEIRINLNLLIYFSDQLNYSTMNYVVYDIKLLYCTKKNIMFNQRSLKDGVMKIVLYKRIFLILISQCTGFHCFVGVAYSWSDWYRDPESCICWASLRYFLSIWKLDRHKSKSNDNMRI